MLGGEGGDVLELAADECAAAGPAVLTADGGGGCGPGLAVLWVGADGLAALCAVGGAVHGPSGRGDELLLGLGGIVLILGCEAVSSET